MGGVGERDGEKVGRAMVRNGEWGHGLAQEAGRGRSRLKRTLVRNGEWGPPLQPTLQARRAVVYGKHWVRGGDGRA